MYKMILVLMFLVVGLQADNMKLAYDVHSQAWVELCFINGKVDKVQVCKTREDVTKRVKIVEAQSQLVFIVEDK